MTDIDSFLERFSKQHSVLLDALPEAERLGIYHTLRDPQPRLAAYFRHYVDDVDKQVRNWRKVAVMAPTL